MDITKRQQIERIIADCIVSDAIRLGFTVSVNDGEEVTVNRSTDVDAIHKALMTTDEDYLILHRPNGTGGEDRGWVRLVYGNDGWDVVCDYSVNIEAVMAGAEAVADRLEAKHG